MNIGFDAKRLFMNTTGLGNYSRTLISSLTNSFPENSYYLYTPSISRLFDPSGINSIKVVLPSLIQHKLFPAAWRSKFVTGNIKKNRLDIYHGLSNEIPFGIHRLSVKLVVTIHDLIFERFPHQYNPIDVYTYRKKIQYACKYAHRIIAVSDQTRKDLMSFYGMPHKKIRVVYQACDPVFGQKSTEDQQNEIRLKYQLPDRFLLYVGSVVERKNLLTLVQAIELLPKNIPLIIVGTGKRYKKRIKAYLSNHNSLLAITWLGEQCTVSNSDLAVIYKLAKVLVYPSVFEGFGLPILEALRSGIPVITSSGSCFAETGGDAAIYVDPLDAGALANAIFRVCHDDQLMFGMKHKGIIHVQKFTPFISASQVMDIYNELCNKMKTDFISQQYVMDFDKRFY